jgi:polysaccharide deacetylase family protein (PEP-CTERM system associated)
MSDQCPKNAFCVDLEEWFHSFGIPSPYNDPSTWDDAPSTVVRDTESLMRLLDDAGVRGTFLTVGWLAKKHPDLIRRLAREGHEIGCHSYWHRLVYSLTPEDFEADLAEALSVLRDISGQPVDTFRAPGFSVKADTFWCFPILRRQGVTCDISVVPARRDHGGVASFPRDPFLLETECGTIRCFPVSVMSIAGLRIPFSGGGYLRLFPNSIIDKGFRQNASDNRPGMSYIHPREINPKQHRFARPPLWPPGPRVKYWKYYVNVASTEPKLARILKQHRFGTVADVLAGYDMRQRFRLTESKLIPT